MTDPGAVGDRVLERVPSEAEAEVRVEASREGLTRFARSFIHQNVSEEGLRVTLRVALGRRVAASSTNRADDAALDRLASNALEAARLQPVDPGWPGVAPPAPPLEVEHHDDATALADPGERAARVRGFVGAADGLEAAGYCSSDGVTAAYANTAGQRLIGRASSAVIDGVARTPGSDGSARAASVRLADLDGRRVGEEAARRARDAADPHELPPGRYEVVLEPGCVANLLSFLAIYGFNGRAVEEGRSFVMLGEQQLDPAVTLRDDAGDPRTMGLPFDTEGTPKRPLDLVRDGVSTAICHDRRTAKALGAETTGHAIPGAASWGAVATNLILEPGGADREALIRGVESGLLVTDFWYTRVLDPRTLVVTGLTRNGVWLVERGRVTRAVRNLRFTQSYADALAPGAVRAIGSELALVPAALGLGACAVPALHLAAWNFTGGASG